MVLYHGSNVEIKDFGVETSEEWARFALHNRNRKFRNFADLECNFDNKY